MITGGQMRAARALLGIDQMALAKLAGLSLPTIQRMEGAHPPHCHRCMTTLLFRDSPVYAYCVA